MMDMSTHMSDQNKLNEEKNVFTTRIPQDPYIYGKGSCLTTVLEMDETPKGLVQYPLTAPKNCPAGYASLSIWSKERGF
jgi:hypothetical protein